MAKNFKKWMATVLALCMCLSVCVVPAMAADPEETTIPVESLPGGGTEEIDVVISFEKNDNKANTVIETPKGGDVTDSGLIVEYHSDELVETDGEGNVVRIEGETDYTAVDPDGYYRAEGGSEVTTKENPASGLTVEIPSESGKTDTAEGDPAGTERVEGDLPTGEGDGDYDYTVDTVLKPESATVTTTEITVTENTSENPQYEDDLDYINNQTEVNLDNDMVIVSNSYYPENVEVTDGYDFYLHGNGNSSQYYSAFLYKTPSPDYPDEPPVYTDKDGNKYYARRTQKSLSKYHRFEGLYLNGELVEDYDKVYGGIWSNVTQYVMIDAETGAHITTYCADLTTNTQEGWSYNITNIEDASYYSDEQAAMIRTVAYNGYWGTESGLGSLDSVKKMMSSATDENGNAIFTQDEIDSLTDGIAMSATQFAIWTFSNAMSDVQFMNAHYIGSETSNETYFNNYSKLQNIPDDKKDSVALIYKLYNHLINMDPTVIDDENMTTKNTVLNSDNFIKDMSLTVVEKVKDHENNQDDDDTNDAYVTNLVFSLVVSPAENNEDELIVTVLDGDGNVRATRRIGVEGEEGDDVIVADDDGNYTIDGIVMTEGEQNFNITLEGVQNLEQGVYLYTSEVKEDLSSQTMVGIASGKHAVDISMNIEFTLDVNDEVVASEHFWREESYEAILGDSLEPDGGDPDGGDPNGGNPDGGEPTPPKETPKEVLSSEDTGSDEIGSDTVIDEDIALGEPTDETEDKILSDALIDEDIALADVPKTGDMSGIWVVMALMSLLGLAVIGRRIRA